jgi:thymidylate kinase
MTGEMSEALVSAVAECDNHIVHLSERGLVSSRSHEDFLATLFRSLDCNQVRYCVLHSWEELPRHLSSDLDMAVDPKDDPQLVRAFRLLHKKGYWLVNVVNYFVEAYCFRFLWLEGQTINSASVDVIFAHQRGALISPSVKALLSGRRKHGIFWIPAPEAEFSYLLARRIWKGTASTWQQHRLKLLVEQLGRPKAEKLAGELLPGPLKERVVDACAKGRLNLLLGQLKKPAWTTSLVQNPLRLIADLLSDGMRLFRRWLQPTGLFVAVLGPDGAGKSTLVENLVQGIGHAFDRYRLFHWRPLLLWRREIKRDTSRPHSLPPHGRFWSIARLLAYVLDYWLGYWLVIRPLVVRSGLVIFDRYFDDIHIDPKRYRYGGPLWLAKILRLLIPKPHLVLVLDVPCDVVLSRKQEVSLEELQRQRRLYGDFKSRNSNSLLIDATASIKEVTAECAQAISEFLSRRCQRQRILSLTPDLT